MSPTATRSPKATTDQTAPEFDQVRARLPGEETLYERAWLDLSESLRCEYPSSAAFVRHCWEERLHLLLCEADPATADEISTWLLGLDAHHTEHELYRGDWRKRFSAAIPGGFDAYLLSFDPNMYDRHPVRSPRPENMYPADISIIAKAVRELPRVPILIQLSTYSANGANAQGDVLDDVVPRFADFGFTMACRVSADGAMMSMVFGRDASLTPDLEGQFQTWLARRKLASGRTASRS